MAWSAEWSGRYPNLCEGAWSLYHNGSPVYTDIPFQGEPADTYGTYRTFSFDRDGEEGWREYEDGMDCATWCETYAEWLDTVAPDDEWEDIFHAFQECDWRHMSCGGCI